MLLFKIIGFKEKNKSKWITIIWYDKSNFNRINKKLVLQHTNLLPWTDIKVGHMAYVT